MSGGHQSGGDAWKLFKTNIARTKQRVLAKVGAAESTVDSAIAAEADKLFTLFKLMKRLNKSVDKYNEILKSIVSDKHIHPRLKGIAIVQNEMAHDILSFDEKDPNYCSFQECHRVIEAQRMMMEEYIETYYHDPLREYLSQFREIQDRLQELDLRRVDMDRYFRDYSIKANKGKDATSLAKTEAKHQKTKEGYQTLSEELMRDIPLLFNDRQSVFDPAFAAFINSNSKFFVETSRAFQKAHSQVQNINEFNAVNHPWVITPIDSSAMSKNIRSSAVFTSQTYASGSSPASRPRASTIATTSPTSSGSPAPYKPPAYNEYQPSSTSPSMSTASPPNPRHSVISLDKSPYPPQQQPQQTYSPPPTTYQQPSAPPTSSLSPQQPRVSPPMAGKMPPRVNDGRALPVPVAKPKQPTGEALYDFVGQDSSELTFKRGDRIILHSTSGDWLDGELNGIKGSVPNNYIKIL
ncbi:hypothetical protein DFA_11953 [Cavenderia fasciculata]|uniref:SH3 domain-containing protein n=1 Tax=Cavenderia fasciculata TaxID=261658 RepID=F4QEX7_CACFS|nr:uncharacterized protein DFA_11953 [Cavenderia fasciculata]EGG14184.1 hypothetical protein DFA_11953 [Cavenderia fasciculata]|eukprot:XP_004350892.1 hypothetical protein DFA_11953 [Cavenderia fasciculata]